AVASSVEVYALRALSMACALLLSAAVDALSLRGALPLCPGGGGRRGPVRRIDRAAGRFRLPAAGGGDGAGRRAARTGRRAGRRRSEEHTSELQSREKLVCRLLLEKTNHRRGRGCAVTAPR